MNKILPFLEKEVIAHPKDESLLIELGKQYLIRDQLDQGEKYYWKALAVNPSCGKCYVNLGRVFYERGSTSKAFEYMEKAVAATPEDPLVYRNRGQIREAEGDFKGALEDYNKSVSLAPDNVHNYIVRGGYYAESKEPAKAMADFDKAASLAPNDFRAFLRRGMLKYLQQDLEGYCTDIHTAYIVMQKTEPENEMLQELRLRIEDNCDSSRAEYYYNMGIFLDGRNKFELAIAMYNQGLKKFPNHPLLIFYKGNALFRMKKYTDALTIYHTGLKHPSEITAYLESVRTKQPEKVSLNVLEDGFMLGLNMYMAEAYFALGQYDSALVTINKTLVVLPESNKDQLKIEGFYNIRGSIYLAQNNYQQAIRDFNKCIELNPEFAPAYANRAAAKINIAKQVRAKYTALCPDTKRDEFQPTWRLPVKMKINAKETDENITAALEDVNKAIDLDEHHEMAYYLRGHLKKLMNINGSCYDFAKAKKLGYVVEGELLVGCSGKTE
jgi:tetratricopeptide (TPR) repeat protein